MKHLRLCLLASLALLCPASAQDSGKIEAKLDTIIQKLDTNQGTLNEVAKAVKGGAPTTAAPSAPAAPADAAVKADIETVQLNLNLVWMVVTGALVFVMQAGFAMVELGFARAKNSINIIMKNFLDFCISAIVFMFVGFGLMFGTSAGGWIGTRFILALESRGG
jgi:Amt family ammonium transporter